VRDAVDPRAIPDAARAICEELRARNHQAWVVGGCVRDHLLGRDVADWDVCTTALPKELMRAFPKAIPTGIEHGTVTVVRDGAHYEVTTLRGESGFSDGRRPDKVYFLDDITADLARRDFTVNAIAYDPLRETLVDPFDGRGDLGRRMLRAVGDAAQRFQEDGLRILRGARFAATLDFDLDPATERAMEDAIEVFRKVSAERVRDEWMKTMKARAPSRAFDVMQRRGVLAVVSPELTACVGCAQEAGREGDVWVHSLRALDATPKDAVLRIAALLHDIGKPATRAVDAATGAVSFPAHDRVGAELAEAWLRAWRFSNDERARVTHAIGHHLPGYAEGWSDGDVRRWLQRVTPAGAADVLALVRADVTALGGDLAAVDALARRADAVQAAGAALSARDLAIDGNTLMKELGLKPSKQLGTLLATLLARAVDDPSVNTREGLLALARALVAT
jgi:tRNA nucleotidyltransferase (CCA-adding enzyme)